MCTCAKITFLKIAKPDFWFVYQTLAGWLGLPASLPACLPPCLPASPPTRPPACPPARLPAWHQGINFLHQLFHI